jgi:PAS domain S-box-containing protein
MGFIGSCLDITDRMRAEQAARKREEDFKRLAENIPDVIARFDRRGACLYANRALEPAFGVRAADLIGRHAAEALPAPLAGPLGEALGLAFESESEQPFELRLGDEPQRRHFQGRAMPERDASGRVEAVLVVAYDVTARMREDERRAQMLAHERSARANAESETLARDQFLAIVSHELRSPLNGIKSWTHVLENHLRDGDATVQRALSGIMIGVEHQVRLIEDLLDVTRAFSGSLGLVKQPMPLLPSLVDAVETLRAAALDKDLLVETDYGVADCAIHGDADRIRQVFLNLISNAVKFSRPGGTIWVSASADDNMARVEVRDDGAGIAPEFLPYVFDPFRQADTTSSRRSQQGLGLGLALVQRIAELHGGYATCESAGLGHGSTLRVFLPLRRESGARVVVESPKPAPATSMPSLNGIHVLLIDDQREARESLAALLGQAGASVVAAASGQEALAHLAIADPVDRPEVIVCDIAMPDEDGYATLRRIRHWEATRGGGRRRRPAIALSAFSQREDRIRALTEGFQMHMTKPVAPAELVTVISSVARGLHA